MCRRRFQRTSEPVAQRSIDPVDRMKAEKARRAELVQIALQMAFPEAVEHTFRLPLQVGEHAVVCGIVPGPQRHLRFIDFNEVFQWVAIRIDHRPPLFVGPA